ncbi:hypothetical protein LABALGNA3A7_09490 [Dellaglioa algida]|nr:hypothetical protein LABALGNA3A7_09490 [Dellaglioa algida]
MELNGQLVKVNKRLIMFELDRDVSNYELKRYLVDGKINADIFLIDKNMITSDQRKKVFALMGDIAGYTGYSVQETYEMMKVNYMTFSGCQQFSLKTNHVSRVFASKFIEFCIEWCFQNEIPFKYREYHLSADESRTLFIYTKYRMCWVCGKPHSDIAHVESVGAGSDRKSIDHRNHHFMCLCREHHVEQHTVGIKTFMKNHHLIPIKISNETLIDLGLMTAKQIREIDEEKQ